MSDSTDDNSSDSTPQDHGPGDAANRSRSTRIALVALAVVVCFGLANYVMRAVTPGATLVVQVDEEDELADIVLSTKVVKIRQIDGPMVHTVRPGRHSVRAGKYRIDAQLQGVRLEFSTGEAFEIKKDQVLTMVVTSLPDDDEHALDSPDDGEP